MRWLHLYAERLIDRTCWETGKAVASPLTAVGLRIRKYKAFMSESKSNPIVLVDFDGVIHSYVSGWKGADVIPDPPVPGAIDWIMDHLPTPEPICAMAAPYIGPEVQIYSSRSAQSGGVKAMQEWLIKHGLPASYISEGLLKFPTAKNAAFLTIDDRAICFDGRFPTTQEIMSFRPWNKRVGEPGLGLIGATGQHPHGRLNADDEGELRCAVGRDGNNVVVKFGKPVGWFGLPPEQALQLASLLTKHAGALRS